MNSMTSLIVFLILFSGCGSSTGSKNDKIEEGTPQSQSKVDETGLTTDSPESTDQNSSSTTDAVTDTTNDDLPPLQPPDARQVWRSMRGIYKIVSRNGTPVCKELRSCTTTADRLDDRFVDPGEPVVIPQLLVWNFILSREEGEGSGRTKRIAVPVFSDRGNVKVQEGGLLTYDFEGIVRVGRAGAVSLKVFLSVKRVDNNRFRIHLDFVQDSTELHDDFEVYKELNSELNPEFLDPPPELKAGLKVAFWEKGAGSGQRYRGFECEIVHGETSDFYIMANVTFVLGDSKSPEGFLYSKNDYRNVFHSSVNLWGSASTVTENAGASERAYISVFSHLGPEPVEIPVFGSGQKSVVSNADKGNIEKLIAAVDSFCTEAVEASL